MSYFLYQEPKTYTKNYKTAHHFIEEIRVQEFTKTLFFCVLPDAPEFTQHPEDIVGIEGENLVFSCSVEGNPQPSIKWTKNNNTFNIEADSDLNETSSGNTHTLTIQNVHRSDEGQYRCVASNSIGNTTSNTGTLKVHCKYFAQDVKWENWSIKPMTSANPWVRFPFKPEFFQVSSFQLLKLKHLHCDDLHIILSLSAVQIYDYFIY